ncbi:MAG TPA: maltose alpha-D-glucosyltransferase [Candidatus Dormibacteraeota bacterium]|nr:maltose alpha-D-glucosyltransferase [Candidatus Dormibacteraeota bacterium]
MTDDRDSTWYKDAIIYELHIKSFYDSNDDGIGDFKGLIEKLDYIARLGVTAIWMLPFYVSPLRDDGYDIADYRKVNPSYGNIRDVKLLIKEAHKRGLRVINELVCNHTSDQHPWFQRARQAKPGSAARDYYVWSDTNEKWPDARIIFRDFETSNWTWDAAAQAFFWHRFYSNQPDLNFDSPRVRDEILRVCDYWLDMGMDGMRLDAIPYLYEREGTNCENLPESHEFLRSLRQHIDDNYANRMLLAEANQWPEDSAAYFGAGDECNMAFHFPVMPRLYLALRMEDRFPIVDILAQTPSIPESCQWAMFLRNHDELTLEMVTDEERDYMYRAYTEDPVARINLGIRRRLAPLLQNNRRRIELMNALLFSLPGTPVIYYGDEIGMGDNIYLGDRDSVRTPMQWTADRNAGFSAANRQRLFLPVILDPEYHYEAVNVAIQEANPQSLLNWMRRLISMRKKYSAFGRGSFRLLAPDNRRMLAFMREHGEEQILVIANLSRFPQFAHLDLSGFAGLTPVEMFGHTEFPTINQDPYLFTLGPHGFYWFALQAVRPYELGETVTKLTMENGDLERALPRYLVQQRWYGARSRRLREVGVTDTIRVGPAELKVVEARYTEGDPLSYVLPLHRTGEGDVVDAMGEASFGEYLLESMGRRRKFRGEHGELQMLPTAQFRALTNGAELPPTLMRGEQTNTSAVFGERLILKLFRRLEEGINPDVEVADFLTQRGYEAVAPVGGSIVYRWGRDQSATIAMLQEFVPNQGSAWEAFLRELGDCTEWEADRELPYPRLLGQRTAEMHLALASETLDPAFAPEPTTSMARRSVYQSVRGQAVRTFQLLRAQLSSLPESQQGLAREVLAHEADIHDRMRLLIDQPVTATRIRIHGDYHLGQVLFTGTDFVVVDFEGEPARPISERRLKRWVLRDVAGMLRSFAYVGEAAGGEEAATWARRMAGAFYAGYLEATKGAPFLPQTEEEHEVLLDTMLIEKVLYELRYEIDHRPDWAAIPLRGLLDLVNRERLLT